MNTDSWELFYKNIEYNGMINEQQYTGYAWTWTLSNIFKWDEKCSQLSGTTFCEATQWLGGFGNTFGDGELLNFEPAYAVPWGERDRESTISWLLRPTDVITVDGLRLLAGRGRLHFAPKVLLTYFDWFDGVPPSLWNPFLWVLPLWRFSFAELFMASVQVFAQRHRKRKLNFLQFQTQMNTQILPTFPVGYFKSGIYCLDSYAKTQLSRQLFQSFLRRLSNSKNRWLPSRSVQIYVRNLNCW